MRLGEEERLALLEVAWSVTDPISHVGYPNLLSVICYLYVLTFHRISEIHTRSELVLIICVNRDLVLRFLCCYEVLDFLVLVLVPTMW